MKVIKELFLVVGTYLALVAAGSCVMLLVTGCAWVTEYTPPPVTAVNLKTMETMQSFATLEECEAYKLIEDKPGDDVTIRCDHGSTF